MPRFVSTREGIGVLDGGDVRLVEAPWRDLGAALIAGHGLDELVRLPTRSVVPLDQVELLAPVPRPPKIWGVGFAYRAHRIEEGLAPEPGEPHVFLLAPTAVTGPGAPIRLPAAAPAAVDYEGELGVVIGRRATDVPVASALDHVAAFTICNDVSARDVQHGRDARAGMRPDITMAKSFDTFLPTGPMLTTLDELADPLDLELTTTVDGEVRQHARTSDHLYPVPELIAFLSRWTTLEPGDLISTGTPAGVGHVDGRYLAAGSTVSVAIEGLGVLTNSVEGPA